MPRTIESIVENHRIARERINAGRPVWDRTINVKAILFRDKGNTTEAHAAAVANEIAALLRSSLPASYFDVTSPDFDFEFDDLVDSLATLTPTSFADDPSYSVLEELTGRLDELYDWANRQRIWLGSPPTRP